VYLPCYLVIAFVVLRNTWANDIVDLPGTPDGAVAEGSRDGMPRLAPAESPPPSVRTPIPRSTMIAWGALAVLGGALGVAWTTSGHVGRGIIGIGASIAALVLWFASILRG
jgi:hypothetical protein